MTTKAPDDLTKQLRSMGLRKKLAKQIGHLDGNARRAGAKGEKRARQAVEDLSAAVDEIQERVLSKDAKRRAAARRAAQTRKRSAAKRRASAKQGAETRKRVTRARSGAKQSTVRTTALHTDRACECSGGAPRLCGPQEDWGGRTTSTPSMPKASRSP
jgi:hypothetical protein